MGIFKTLINILVLLTLLLFLIPQLIGTKIDEPEFRLRRDSLEIRVLHNMSYVVVEYMSGGTLHSFLSKNRENKLCLKFVIQLALHLARG